MAYQVVQKTYFLKKPKGCVAILLSYKIENISLKVEIDTNLLQIQKKWWNSIKSWGPKGFKCHSQRERDGADCSVLILMLAYFPRPPSCSSSWIFNTGNKLPSLALCSYAARDICRGGGGFVQCSFQNSSFRRCTLLSISACTIAQWLYHMFIHYRVVNFMSSERRTWIVFS